MDDLTERLEEAAHEAAVQRIEEDGQEECSGREVKEGWAGKGGALEREGEPLKDAWRDLHIVVEHVTDKVFGGKGHGEHKLPALEPTQLLDLCVGVMEQGAADEAQVHNCADSDGQQGVVAVSSHSR